MACLTYTCWNTLGLVTKLPVNGLIGRENQKIGNGYSSTYSSSSLCTFVNGPRLSLSLLTGSVNRGGCGASFGPQIFNGAGTLTWKAISTLNRSEKTIIPGKTWKQCGITKGIWTVYVTWTPTTCAKNKGFIATKSYATPAWIYP